MPNRRMNIFVLRNLNARNISISESCNNLSIHCLLIVKQSRRKNRLDENKSRISPLDLFSYSRKGRTEGTVWFSVKIGSICEEMATAGREGEIMIFPRGLETGERASGKERGKLKSGTN